METGDAIQTRLDYMHFSARERQALEASAPIIKVAIDEALTDVYRRMRKFDEAAKFFHSDEHMAHAKEHQARHWARITKGDFGQEFYESSRRIGRTHARIGLQVRWYVGTYAVVAEHLIRSIVLSAWPTKRGLLQRRTDPDQLILKLSAAMKAIFLDADIAVSTFQEDAYQELIDKLCDALTDLAEGDLTHRITGTLDRFKKLQADFNNAAGGLEGMIGTVAAGACALQGITSEVAAATADLAQRTERQASSIEATASTLAGVTETAATSARIAAEARDAAHRTAAEATGANAIVSEAAASMDGIERSSREVVQITQMVEQIAFQTNLLALNASVEAARAGDAGRGFAVVAHEVRMLAQRSDEAAKSISQLIDASGREVAAGAAKVRETGAVLDSLVGRVNRIGELIDRIASATEAQAQAIADINRAISAMEGDTQHNAAMVEESTAATRQLAMEAERLAATAGKFRTTGGQGMPAPAPAQRVKRAA